MRYFIFSMIIFAIGCGDNLTPDLPDAGDSDAMVESDAMVANFAPSLTASVRLDGPFGDNEADTCPGFVIHSFDLGSQTTHKEFVLAPGCADPELPCQPFPPGRILKLKGIPYSLECGVGKPWRIEILEIK